MGDGIHIALRGDAAKSWRKATESVLQAVCGKKSYTPTQIQNSEQKLIEENKQHLNSEGAYSDTQSLEAPQNADHRYFSKLYSDTEIYVVPNDFCPTEEPSQPNQPPQQQEEGDKDVVDVPLQPLVEPNKQQQAHRVVKPSTGGDYDQVEQEKDPEPEQDKAPEQDQGEKEENPGVYLP